MQEIGKYSDSKFFDRDVQEVSKDLLGRVLEHLVDGIWLSVRIIETEAYYGQGQEDRASHASLGKDNLKIWTENLTQSHFMNYPLGVDPVKEYLDPVWTPVTSIQDLSNEGSKK